VQSKRPRVNPIPKQTLTLKVELLTNHGVKTRSPLARANQISGHNNRASYQTNAKMWPLQTAVQTVKLLHPESDQRMHTPYQ
jgi:hypothetical protein